MENIVWGNVVANGGLIFVVGWAIKHWINATEKTVQATASALAAVTLQHGKDLADTTEKARREIKESAQNLLANVTDTKQDVFRITGEIKDQIKTMGDNIVKRMDVANGRTGKNEDQIKEVLAKIAEVKTTCAERSKFYGRA